MTSPTPPDSPDRPGRIRGLVAVALATVACVAAAARVAPLGPFVQVAAYRESHNDAFDVWCVKVKVRGGEPVEELAIQPTAGPATVLGGDAVRDVAPGDFRVFQVRVDGGSEAAVRLVQKGKGARTYDVTLGTKP